MMLPRTRALFRSSTSALLLGFFFVAGATRGSAQDALELWKNGPVPSAAAIAQFRTKAPPDLRPLFDLTSAYEKAMRNSPPGEWRPGIQKLAAQADLSMAVKEAALMWEARARIAELRQLLMAYYKKKATFPSSLSAIADTIPPELKSDPWGQPWQYEATAPAHFPKLAGQSFKLVPSKYPGLQSLADLASTGFIPPKLTVGAANVGTINAMRVALDAGSSVILQEGLTSRNIGLVKVTPGGSLWAVDGFLIFKSAN